MWCYFFQQVSHRIAEVSKVDMNQSGKREDNDLTVFGTLDAEARRHAMVEQLNSSGNLQLNEAAIAWNVHPMTIRRDFDAFVNLGLARRVRGGVIALRGDHFENRRHQNVEAKRVIARKLLSLLTANSVVALDSSTTIAIFAEAIPDGGNVTIITNGQRAFQTLHGREHVRVFLTGGQQEDQNESLVGTLAENAIREFAVETAFLSAMSLDPDFGTSEMTMEQVAFKRVLVETAQQVVLAVDSSKLSTRARFRSLSLSDRAVLVTELEPTDPRLAPYRERVSRVL